MTRFHSSQVLFILALVLFSCSQKETEVSKEPQKPPVEEIKSSKVSFDFSTTNPNEIEDGSLEFILEVGESGRYRVSVYSSSSDSAVLWLEDYIRNTDDRTYNITGSLVPDSNGTASVDGSPLATGMHQMRLNVSGKIKLDSITFVLMQKQTETQEFLTQKMEGEDWELVWSDEFDGEGLPDENKWSYNVGNWGWGNNEPQYYTDARVENVRQEGGKLIIEARKNDEGMDWSSARLTTQGKTSFTYGKIEFRAKVPEGRGTWAAGWLLGDAYRDEVSWPYCGEIDVLECVGYEINDTTGSGLNHATCHTRKYYFKQGNQIGSEIAIDSMNTKFHTYAIECYPDGIHGYLDGVKYYTYDKTADELEWPFNNPQNIILNLAVGGGWGGAKGIDENHDSHLFVLDYVRVYGKK